MFWTSPTPAYQKEESEAGAQQQKFTMGLHITESEGVNKRQAGMGDCWGLLPPLGLRGQRQDEVSSRLKSHAVWYDGNLGGGGSLGGAGLVKEGQVLPETPGPGQGGQESLWQAFTSQLPDPSQCLPKPVPRGQRP